MFGYEGAGQVLLRLCAIFAVALIVVRGMGNRAVGQLSPFDFVLMVGIGDIVANIAVARGENLLTGVEALLGLLILQQILSRLAMKNETLRKWFEGTPVKLIDEGRILKDQMEATHFNIDDLRQELHKQGMDLTRLKDIHLARLESCGEFTVVRVPDAEPMTRRDFEIYMKDMAENPLSPIGARMVKLERLMEDVRVLADRLKDLQQPDGKGADEARADDARQGRAH